MLNVRLIVPFVGFLTCAACASRSHCAAPAASAHSAIDARKLIDLTHAFDEQTVYWPTESEGFRLSTRHHGPTAGGYFYAANSFSAPEHGGTHLDAPIHFAEGRNTADRLELERLVGAAIVIDISQRAASDRDTLLGVADIEAFERAHGAITPRSIVLVRTDWSRRWPNRLQYLGDDSKGDAANLHFPGIGADAAHALVARKVGAVGIDTASIDNGPSRDFMAHRVLMEANIPAFENLTNLEALPVRGALLLALPMKIGGGSGAPLRALAVLP